jgi:hypothetical protein
MLTGFIIQYWKIKIIKYFIGTKEDDFVIYSEVLLDNNINIKEYLTENKLDFKLITTLKEFNEYENSIIMGYNGSSKP